MWVSGIISQTKLEASVSLVYTKPPILYPTLVSVHTHERLSFLSCDPCLNLSLWLKYGARDRKLARSPEHSKGRRWGFNCFRVRCCPYLLDPVKCDLIWLDAETREFNVSPIPEITRANVTHSHLMGLRRLTTISGQQLLDLWKTRKWYFLVIYWFYISIDRANQRIIVLDL